MKRIIALLLTLFLLTGLLSACGEHEHVYDSATDYLCNECDHNRLVGVWTATIEGQKGSLEFKADGTGNVTGAYERPYEWDITDGKLTINQNIDGFNYLLVDKADYKLEEDTLTIITPSGDTKVFKKK